MTIFKILKIKGLLVDYVRLIILSVRMAIRLLCESKCTKSK